MTRRVLDFDPVTGVTTYFDYDKNDVMTITETQDISHILRHNMAARNDDEKTKNGIKNDWWQYARIPNTLLVKWKHEYGIDFNNQNDLPKILKLINTEYQYLKTTDKNHSIKHA